MSDRLNVLFVVHNQTRKGGAYYRGLNLGAPLARRGHQVTLLTISPTARIGLTERQLDGVRVVESPDLLWGVGRTGWDPWDTLVRTAWIRRQRLDIIHTVDTRPAVALPAWLGRKASGAAWVADWTDWWGRGGATYERDGWLIRSVIGPLEEFFEEKPRPYADATVVISRALGQRAEGLGIDGRGILYLPPGADPAAIRDIPIPVARERCALDPGAGYVGYLGNIYQRDADLLFDTLRRLRTPGVRLLMVGDPGCRVPDDLQRRVQITGRISFESMLEHLSACDVLALPLCDTIANRGRWPSKVNEYVAVGRPMVACDVGDVASLLKEDEIGLLVRPEPGEFADRIDQLLGDPQRAAAMGQRARSIAQTSYSQEAIADKLESFYLQIAAARAAASSEKVKQCSTS
jgi:glycosyltransferase involved in cell wall biosynthesis